MATAGTSKRLHGTSPGLHCPLACSDHQPPASNRGGTRHGSSRTTPHGSGGRGGGSSGQWRRTDPVRSSGRAGSRASGSRGGDFRCPLLHVSKCSDSGLRLKLLDDRDDVRRRDECGAPRHHDLLGVLSDSENEEPISKRIRHISAFIRKTKTALSSGAQRSRSCTDPMEDRGKMMVVLQPALMDTVGVSHSFSAGILLSSENSRSVSVPILPPQRRLAWRAVVTPSSSRSHSGPVPVVQPERSVSPDSNDSISEELNHFKPIVCSPCTPPKRLEDGRVLEPRIVKSTPRNLRSLTGPQASSYETSAAVLQKCRQIEIDRKKVSMTTLTSPVSVATSPANDKRPRNRRRLLFNSEETVKIRVPALHPQDHRLDGFRFGSTSKRKQKTKHTEAKRSCHEANANPSGGDNVDASANVSEQERSDRALALRLQRQFDTENSTSDPYFLRSWTNQSQSLKSCWANESGGRGLRCCWTNQNADGTRVSRSSRRNKKQ